MGARPAPAHLPAGRAHLRPGGDGAGQGRARRPPSGDLATVLDDLLEARIPAPDKDASTALAADWTDVETFARPPRHGSTECAGPKPPGGTATATCPAPRARC